MANYSIDIPGDTGVSMQENDTLTITFKTPAKFCITSGNADDFDPPLPAGVAEPKDYEWSGTAVVANATITYSHVGHDGTCGSPNLKNVPPGTIQIGTGTK
jgi:hypothetical protein